MKAGPPAAAVATNAASGSDDATIEQCLEMVETLINVFGFDADAANEAVEAVGTDLSKAYNWILDRGHEDKGGPVVPRLDCPHISRQFLVKPSCLQIDLPCGHYAAEVENKTPAEVSASSSGSCKGGLKSGSDVSGSCPAKENWICLHCGITRCSRYEFSHAVDHWKQTKAEADVQSKDNEIYDDDNSGHCIAVSLADLSIWCYECHAYLKHPNFEAVTRRLESLKFPEDTPEKKDISESKECSTTELHVPLTLPQNLKEMADFILSDKCQSIAILAGAGMSKASGIPDFRSAGGLYETLRPEELTASEEERMLMANDPTAVFDRHLFLKNPLPCLELERSFILGTREARWRATIAHRFVELLHQKTGKLTRLYTQNIDGLESQCTDLPREKVVCVHGSMHRAACEMCGEEADFDEFCDDVQRNIKDISGQDPSAPPESTGIPCKTCTYNAVKPVVVLFHSSLPEEFFTRANEDIPNVDLLIVIGTSLTVAPANTLVCHVPPTCMRMVVNNEPVGIQLGIDYGEQSTRDFFARGYCDDVFLDLICHLGWLSDLEKFAEDLPESSLSLLRNRQSEGT
mmetsp:Transcript_61555/g.71931  ORF Transcript_61555/g.71931 Transcript_61555/m.71931 type:complete len:576 (-) Transcript_61555:87-1814(-)